MMVISENRKSRQIPFLDVFRIIAAFLVIAIHTSPLTSINGTADFIFTQIISRVAVPFFFMATGFFMYSHLENRDPVHVKGFTVKIAKIYAAAIALYLPLNLYAGHYSRFEQLAKLPQDIFFNGTFYHLWYLPAVLLGVIVTSLLVWNLGIKRAFTVSILLYALGLLGDSYYGLTERIIALSSFYDILFKFFDYTRNGLFFAPVFIIMGGLVSKQLKKSSDYNTVEIVLKNSYKNRGFQTLFHLLGFIISMGLMIVEGLILHRYQIQRHDSMYIMLVPTMYFLFQILTFANPIGSKGSKPMRQISLMIYIVHPWMIVITRAMSKITDMDKVLIGNSLGHFLAVSVLSFVFSWSAVKAWTKIGNSRERSCKDNIEAISSNTSRVKSYNNVQETIEKISGIVQSDIAPGEKSRAWIEIDIAALKHNVNVLKNILPPKCQLMAVVKANAYGHGDILISKELNKLGVNSFAVATLSEGVMLRKNGIVGEILVLGYTNPVDARFLAEYDLTQAIVDFDHGKKLNAAGIKIKVHIKLDTGMHRLGIKYSEHSDIEAIFNCTNIQVKGMFTHLCSADSMTPEDVAYTRQQINNFYKTVVSLEDKGYDTGKLHVQSSYGILNYPELNCDYARIGIALYGVLSDNNKTWIRLPLKPVLSLKARIALVRDISANEWVGYSRCYKAKSNKRIAVVTIGYGDGIPRNLSEAGGYTLINSKMAPIVGRVCMDQLLIDVSDIDGVKSNDIVTIIGQDGSEEIRCEDMAEKCGTISNEILSRLGSRLPIAPVINRHRLTLDPTYISHGL